MKTLILFSFLFTLNLFAQTKITLLQFNDLHAHLTPHKTLVRVGDPCLTDPNGRAIIGERGGLARLKTLVNRFKSQNPNTILMNIGDTYHGGVEASYTTGNAIVDPVNQLGIDVGVPGNWDFAYGPAVFRKRYLPSALIPTMFQKMLPSYPIKTPTFTNIAANLTFKNVGPLDPTIEGNHVLPPTMMIEKNGVKIGFIGITSDIVPQMDKRLTMGFNFVQGEENYKNLINKYASELRKQGAHIVMVMSELGIQKAYRLAQIINPGVDVIFSAHTHELTYKPLTSASGTWVVESGHDAYLGKMDLTVVNGKVVKKKWEVHTITPDIPEDLEMLALVKNERESFLRTDPNMNNPLGPKIQELHQPISTVVGYTTGLLTRMNSLENSFNNAFTDLLRKKTGAQLAISSGFRYDSPVAQHGFLYEDESIASGEITLEDLYRFFPGFATIATAEIRGDSLKMIVEERLTKTYSQNAFLQEGGWVGGFSGIDITLNLNKPDGARVIGIKYSGTDKDLKADDVLSVASCKAPGEEASNMLCRHSGFTNKAELINSSTGKAWTPIDMLVDYMKTDNLQVGKRHSFVDVSRNAIWPQYMFVQPLPNDLSCIGSKN